MGSLYLLPFYNNHHHHYYHHYQHHKQQEGGTCQEEVIKEEESSLSTAKPRQSADVADLRYTAERDQAPMWNNKNLNKMDSDDKDDDHNDDREALYVTNQTPVVYVTQPTTRQNKPPTALWLVKPKQIMVD